MLQAPVSLIVGKHTRKDFSELFTKDLSHIVETVSRRGLTSKNSRHEFLILRDLATHHIKNLVFFSFHGSHALFGSSTISSSIAADVIWNSICTLSGLDIQNASWFTWRRTRVGQVGTDPYQAAQAAAGYPNLKKGRAILAALGDPHRKKAREVHAALGYPGLRKGHSTQAADGYTHLKQSANAQAAAGYPNLRKAWAVNKAAGHPHLQKANEANAALGYPGLQKAREVNIALGHPGTKAHAAKFNARRLAKIDALRDTTEIRQFLAQEPKGGPEKTLYGK